MDFRKEYKELTEEQKAAIEAIKDKAEALGSWFFVSLPNKDERCMSIAKTKLEEAVMWAVKGITA